MSELDKLVNKFIFKGKENRAFSSKYEDMLFLNTFLENDKVEISQAQNKGYFYCVMKKGNIEVVADSRANVCPKTPAEAHLIAALKIYMPDTESNWAEVVKALNLDPSKFKK